MEDPLNVKKPLLISFILFVFSILYIGCDNQPTYLSFQDIENAEWHQNDTIKLLVPARAASTPPSLLIRHNDQYGFQNIWIKLKVGNGEFERKEILLANAEGFWFGEKSGGLYTHSYPLEDVEFLNDSTTVYMTQNMRADPLKGIQAVGIEIE